MSWPMQNTGPWNPGMMMAPDMNMGSYTPEQWAAMQQQNWQQWTQWQQQYAQWQSQYGDKYAQQMQAIQAMGGMGGMPPLPPPDAVAPPAPPPPEKPPPPPHENNQPLYGHKASELAPVPAPVVTQQNMNSNNNINIIPIAIQTGKANKHPPAATVPSGNVEALKKLAEEERLFDIQFQKWEEEIEKWKKDNVNHPDKQAYKEYEEKFESCRAQLLERRQQMNKKKARLLESVPLPPQPASTTVTTNVNTPPHPVQNVLNATFPKKQQQNYNSAMSNTQQHFGNNSSTIYSVQSNAQYQNQQLFNMPPNQNAYNRSGIDIKEADGKYQYSNNNQYSNDSFTGTPGNPSFFLPSESNKKGIPGLDLVPDSDKFLGSNSKQEVIDITGDKPAVGPDYTTISKGINNILGDEKIMNILSMVRGQVAPDSTTNIPPIQTNQSGHYTGPIQSNSSYDSQYNNPNYNNQQFDTRHNVPLISPDGNYVHQNNQNLRNPVLQNRNVEEQQNSMMKNHFDNYERGIQSSNNNKTQYDKGVPPTRPNMNSPRPLIRPLLQDMPGQNDYSRGIQSSDQQNTNDFYRNSQGQGQQNVIDYPRRPQNEYSRGPTGPERQNDYSRGPPIPVCQSDYSRGPSGSEHQTDYSRGPPVPDHQNDYSRVPPGLGQQIVHDYPRGSGGVGIAGGPAERRLLLDNNIDPVASQPVRPKWVDEPMFSPSLIVEYEHKPLRLKARDFIEPVHMFDYNHKSKEGNAKKEFEKGTEEIFTRKPRRSEKEIEYGGGRYNRDFYCRDFERRAPRDDLRDEYRTRVPPRDDYDDRRKLDDDKRRFDDDRRRLDDNKGRFDTRFDDRRRDDRDKYMRRDDMYRDRDRDTHRDRDRDRDSRREDLRIRSGSRDRESRKRELNKDNEVSDITSKKSKDSDDILGSIEEPKHVVMIDDLLELPGREMRPEKIVIILRGPPGSGKSFLAKLIRDKEAEHGGTVRIMSIDDYFMQEGEVEEKDSTTGKMIKKPTLKYEYDEASEETYLSSLKRAFRRCLTDGYFTFVIYDAVNDTLKSYADIWNFSRQNDFQVYICTMELDPQLCYKRNIHNRKLSDIEVISARFFPTPRHHIQLDATTLLQSGAITEVQMEDADDEVVMEDAQETEVESVFTSKWETMDDAAQLARLDGTSKPLRPSQLSMEDYLQIDDWKPSTAKPGKKTVRWADIEERRQQEKMRAIGFVVGQTDWNRMTDPTMGSSALTQTKYIERVTRR